MLLALEATKNEPPHQPNYLKEPPMVTSPDSRPPFIGLGKGLRPEHYIEILEKDYPNSAIYLGKEEFTNTANAYFEAHPSDTPKARLFGRYFSQFLSEYEPRTQGPECTELAQLEQALNKAFDAKDARSIDQSNLVHLTESNWPTLTFTHHPSTSRVSFISNAPEIWSTLTQKQTPPQSKISQMPTELIIWRGQDMPRFRAMSYDEAMIWDEAGKGINFAGLCEMLGTYWPKDQAQLKAAGYLQSWLSSEFLTHQPD